MTPSSSRRAFLCQTVTLAFATPSLFAAEDPLRAAVIGHTGRGDYGHGLDGIFRGRPGIRLLAVADPDPKGRAAAVERTGAERGYADFREMLQRERPQLVSIAMRHADQHHEIGLECLRAGAHCYFEKPFARTPAESDALLAAAKQKGLKIAVAHTMRMMPQVAQLQQKIRGGLLGDIAEVRAYGKQDARAGGEDMMVLGTHLFDLLRLFLGDPEWVEAEVLWNGRKIKPADRRQVRDNVGWVAGNQVNAMLGFPNGVVATFVSDGRLRESIGHWGLEFIGSRGVARINCDIAPNVFVRSTDGWKTSGKTDVWKPLAPELTEQPPEHNLGPVGDWLDAIARQREPECSGRNGAWAVEMVMSVYTAALANARVRYPLRIRAHPLREGA